MGNGTTITRQHPRPSSTPPRPDLIAPASGYRAARSRERVEGDLLGEAGMRPDEGEGISNTAPPELPVALSWWSGSRSAGVECQRDLAEQRLKRPAGSQVDANAAGGLADAGADFEEPCAQSFDLRRTPRLRQVLTEEIDQIVSGGVQQQAKGVGQETVAAQTVGAEA